MTPGLLRRSLPAGDVDWQIVSTGDFNGDGHADIFWRHKTTGWDYVWLMNGAAKSAEGPLPTIADPNWTVVSR